MTTGTTSNKITDTLLTKVKKASLKLSSQDLDELIDYLIASKIEDINFITKLKALIQLKENKSSTKLQIDKELKKFINIFLEITSSYGYQKPKITKAIILNMENLHKRLKRYYETYMCKEKDLQKLERFYKIFSHSMIKLYKITKVKPNSVLTMVCNNKIEAIEFFNKELSSAFPGYLQSGNLQIILNNDNYISFLSNQG